MGIIASAERSQLTTVIGSSTGLNFRHKKMQPKLLSGASPGTPNSWTSGEVFFD